jgi:5-methylcytosine-specific restriction endonuclease McrA
VRSRRRSQVSSSFRRNRFRALRTTNGRCAFCGAQTLIVDHRLPLSLGGTDEVDNLQPVCEAHHRDKTVQESLMGKLAARGELSQADINAHVDRWTPSVMRYRGQG